MRRRYRRSPQALTALYRKAGQKFVECFSDFLRGLWSFSRQGQDERCPLLRSETAALTTTPRQVAFHRFSCVSPLSKKTEDETRGPVRKGLVELGGFACRPHPVIRVF
jgi:hypothetical protein